MTRPRTWDHSRIQWLGDLITAVWWAADSLLAWWDTRTASRTADNPNPEMDQ